MGTAGSSDDHGGQCGSLRLKVSVSKEPKTGGIAAVREVSVRERLLRLLLGEMRRVIVLIPGDKVDEIAISEEVKTDERTENEG